MTEAQKRIDSQFTEINIKLGELLRNLSVFEISLKFNADMIKKHSEILEEQREKIQAQEISRAKCIQKAKMLNDAVEDIDKLKKTQYTARGTIEIAKTVIFLVIGGLIQYFFMR